MMLRVESFTKSEWMDKWETEQDAEDFQTWFNDPWNDPTCVEGYLAYCWACDQAEMDMRGIEK